MTDPQELPAVAQRFLRYVRIDTQSDADSKSTPSTAKQKDLGRLLVDELLALGLDDAVMDDHGYVFATLPPTRVLAEGEEETVLALLAHQDTSPEEPGGPVEPIIHSDYAGGAIELPGNPEVILDPRTSPALLDHLGHDIITSDGRTLLGSDDKAGVAIIMQLVEDLLRNPDHQRPKVRVCFTVDEEIGRGVDALDLERLGANVAYTIDGGKVGELGIETFNAAEAVIEIHGVAVHPGSAKGRMVNAARLAGKLVDALPAGEAPETTDGEEGYFHPYQLTATTARAEIRVLLRDFSSEGLERRKELVRRLVEVARVENPAAGIDLRIDDSYKNMRSYIEAQDPRAIELAFAAGKAVGIEIEVERVRGGTDGSRLSELGLPTPNIFTGGFDYHSRFEWNTVQNLEASLAYLKALVECWAGASAGG